MHRLIRFVTFAHAQTSPVQVTETITGRWQVPANIVGAGGSGSSGGDGSATGTFLAASPVFARSINIGAGYVEVTYSTL